MRSISEVFSGFARKEKERHPVPFQIINLLLMEEGKKRVLKDGIRSAGGHVNILVHPYYTSQKNPNLFLQSEDYQLQRDQFIQKTLSDGTPLIIFEQNSEFNLLYDRINASNGILYGVRTIEGSAEPLTYENASERFMSSRERARIRARAWDGFIDSVRDLKVKRATVGGRFMVLHTPTQEHGEMELEDLKKNAKNKPFAREWISKRIIPGACPGEVIKKLINHGIDVSISSISSPTSTLEPTDLSNAPNGKNFY